MLHDLSIVVICFNEEQNLPRLFSSLPKESELIVVDSSSTDRSVEIAKSNSAKTFERPFDNFAAQKNFAISQASKKWTLVLDADEELSPTLLNSIKDLLSKNYTDLPAAFSVPRKLVFLDRKMRFGKTSDNPIRLFKSGKAQFIGEVHEVLNINEGEKVSNALTGHLLHYSYKDISDYFTRFNRYTSMIAQGHLRKGKKVSFISHLFRPWFEFVNRYFFRLGFLDGYEGYVYALFSSLYTFTKYAKYYELVRDTKK